MLSAALVTLTLLVATLILYPLIAKGKGVERESSFKDKLDQLLLEKESSYLGLKELEFDYRIGKLSQQDYESLCSKLERTALSLLKDIERLEQEKGRKKEIESEIDEEIEKEVVRMRRMKNLGKDKKKP